MKYCMHCGQVLPDPAPFCSRCGAAQPNANGVVPPVPAASVPQSGADRATLDSVRVTLRHERTAWKIGAIIFCVCAGLFLLPAFMLGVAGNRTSDLPLYLYAVVYAFGALIGYTPCAVLGFVMVSKCSRYLERFEADPASAVERCGNAGMIVLAAFFNNIALIFVIINFVRCKSQREALERAMAHRPESGSAY